MFKQETSLFIKDNCKKTVKIRRYCKLEGYLLAIAVTVIPFQAVMISEV